MVRILTSGLIGLFALIQLVSALPEDLEKRAVSKYTTTITRTLTNIGPNGHKTKTVTETVPTVVRTTYKKTKTSTTSTTSTTTTDNPEPSKRACASIGDGGYVDKDGVRYVIACNTDYYGGDSAIYQADSFEDCFHGCDSASDCVAFSWVGQGSSHEGPGDCYLKSTLRDAVPNSNVDGAHLQS